MRNFCRAGALAGLMLLLALGLTLLTGPAGAQVGSPVPSTTYTRELLKSSDSNAAWTVLGIVPDGVTTVTQWVMSVSSGATLNNPLFALTNVSPATPWRPVAVPDTNGGAGALADYLQIPKLQGGDAVWSGKISGGLITNAGVAWVSASGDDATARASRPADRRCGQLRLYGLPGG